MSTKPLLRISLLVVAAFSLEAFSESEKLVASGGGEISESTLLDVYKSPTCRCCSKWITHLKSHNPQGQGFKVQAHNKSNMPALKAERGIAPRHQSCHTGVSKEGYVFEGHIPARIIQQFLSEKPEGAIGLAVPGMPKGSPGMEMGAMFSPYNVLLLKADGSSTIYAQITQQQEQY
ncbi:MAG: hypothetical protein CL693_21690 [Cellvibrionaceae bacterium]|nr:hypothetical protein [Cellvibrionaceae bacterium]|tara:strand:+ start:595 stop:1122 length:528 start_codon:yes stop_codon:yes gene_type:complete